MLRGTLGGGEVAEVARRELVVVDDVQALAAIRAREDRVLQRVAVIAAVAAQARRARARPLPRAPGGLCGVGAHAGTRNDTTGHGVCAAPSWPPEVEPQLLGEVWAHRPEHLGEGAASAASRASRVGLRRARGWRSSTRFSKSLMRSNRRITLRTALCISSCSMSWVIRLTPFSHHSASFTRRCSVLSALLLAAAAHDVLALRRSGRLELRVRVVPHAGQEAVAAQHRGVAPVQRALGAGRVQHRQAHGVGPVARDQLVGVDHVAQVLAHLAPVADHHLVEQAARRTARRRRGRPAGRCRAAPS